MKKITILSLVLLLSLSLLAFADEAAKNLKKKGLHVADLSGADQINLQINRIEQAVQQQNAEEIKKMLSDDYIEADPSFKKEIIKETLESIFSTLSKTRGFPTQTNAQTGWKVTATQYFYIRNTKINVQQDKATAECDVGFHSVGKDYRNIKETLSFVLKDHRWLLAGSKNLFGFLRQASKATTKEIGMSGLAETIINGTKDDFTSTYMLVPVNLFVYNGNPVPRFNKTMSFLYFSYFDQGDGHMHWINIMNYPYGILADVQYVEGGPDLSYEFLFVSDVTCDKIVGTEMNKWVGEFGTQGSGEGQFQEPHGMCNLPGFYFVADMFNNRVITYEYEKGWDDPVWRFNLTAGFDWPIDVEVKEANPSAYPPEADYVVVADHRNHRLALFIHAYPYPYTFDRYYGEYGSGEGQFIYPTSVCFGRDPQTGWHTYDVFVTDYGNHRLVWLYIQDVEPYNVFWRATYQFPIDVDLTSVEVDNKGLVYVVDQRNAKVYKFATFESFNFELLGIWGETGAADGQLLYPNTLTVAHGRYCDYPDPCVPLTSLGDVFVSESWGDLTGIRRFVIASDVLNLSASYVPYNEDTGEGNYIWYTYHLTDFANMTEQVYRGAEVCTTYNRGVLNYGSQGGDWNVGNHPHGETYTVKITATSIYDPTVVVQKTVDVYVDTITTHNPIITRGIRCKYKHDPYASCNECWQCIKEGHSYTMDVQSFDPDGDSLMYEWRCGYGYLMYEGYLYKRITIPENYICYVAPTFGENGNESVEGLKSSAPASSNHLFAERPDFIGVTAKNPYGGEAHTSELLTPYDESTSCRCGDVNGNSNIDGADIVFLTNYLYLRGPAPDPLETADANNDCVVDAADMVYLVNYIYLHGPRPECCWIH